MPRQQVFDALSASVQTSTELALSDPSRTCDRSGHDCGRSRAVWSAGLAMILLALAWVSTAAGAAHPLTPPGAGLAGSGSSSAVALTGDGATLAVVNPDSNSVTLVDTASRSVLIELPVGLDPRTVALDDGRGRAYIANRGSGSLSVVDLTARVVITEAVVGAQPYGVVVDPAGGRIYLAEQGQDQVRILAADDLTTVALVPAGNRPSGVALSPDGATLFVTHLLSNSLSLITVRPQVAYLPLMLQGGPMVLAGRPSGPSTAASPGRFPIRQLSLFADSNLAQSIVLSPDGRVAYLPHTRSNSANRALTFETTVYPVVSLVDLAERRHLVGQQFDLGSLDPPGVGLPFDGAVTPDGAELWVVNAASNDISVVDLAQRRLAAHIEVGDNPRGIVMAPDGLTAYVNNTLAGSVSIIDVASHSVISQVVVTEIPLPPVLLRGKQLFYSSDDPRMAQAQWIACNSCHYEGEHDGRTWFFGFAGPRNTTALLGMVETYPLRWSAEWDESADSEYVIRRENFGSGLIEGSLNCTLFPPDCVNHPPNQGRSYDLDCLAAYLDSLAVSLSPAHARGQPLTAVEERGQAVFLEPELGCVACHPPPLYTDLTRHDVGTATADEKIGPAYDTPSLRGLYGSAPYLHDGSAATLRDCLTRPTAGSEHDVRGRLSEGELADLIAFLQALPFER